MRRDTMTTERAHQAGLMTNQATIVPIRTNGESVLNIIAKPVKTFDDALRQLTDNMFATMYAAGGVGLAAPQIGISLRVCVFDIGEEYGPFVMVNPKIVERIGRVRRLEGCLSVPGHLWPIDRAKIPPTQKGSIWMASPS